MGLDSQSLLPRCLPSEESAGSLFAPWAQWQVDKRRDDRKVRRALIATWRNDVRTHFDEFDLTAEVDLPDGERAELIRSRWYDSIRQYLAPGVRADLERPAFAQPAGEHVVVFHQGRLRNPTLDLLLAKIARLEKDWGLD